MSQHTSTRGVLALITGLLVTAGLLTTTAAPAHAGQVGVTIGIQGAGMVWVTEGSLEDGGSTECTRFDNQDHRVTVTCPRIRNDEPFEAWVWLRAAPAPDPLGQWLFDGWSGCDTVRTREGAEECGVHSGAFNSAERNPVARFRDAVAPTISGLQVLQVPHVDEWFQVGFSASDGITQCRDFGRTDWAACTNGEHLPLYEGRHRIEVRAIDPSGNVGVGGVTVVSVNTWFNSGPLAHTSDPSAEFQLRTGAGEEFWCSLDHAPYTLCGSGPAKTLELRSKPDGPHTLRVQARSGTWVDPVPAAWSWHIDTVAPTSTLTPDVHGTSATFALASSEPGYFQCKLDTPAGPGPWEWCASPTRYTRLDQGEHVFSIRIRDLADNLEAVPTSYRWTVDTIAPTSQLVASPTADSATFAFSTVGTASFECRLTTPSGAGEWTRCSSPMTYTGLVPGQHQFEVRATDGAGNVEVVPPAHTWTATSRALPEDPLPGPVVDATAPETTVASGPSGFVLSPGATFGLGSEPGATFRCTLDGAGVPCATTVTLSGLRSGTHTLSAAAVDAAGNVDASPAVRTWTVPVTSRELRIAKGWKLRQTSAAYGGSRLEATRRGSGLTRKVNGARSVALVVGKGRRHGTVAVYAGSRLLSTVRLSAPRTADQVLVPVATFTTPYTGSLRVVVRTQGRPVRIEGLGVATG